MINQLRIGHTKATKSHILSREPLISCHYCGQTLTVDHISLECTVLQKRRDKYSVVHNYLSRGLYSWIFVKSWILLLPDMESNVLCSFIAINPKRMQWLTWVSTHNWVQSWTFYTLSPYIYIYIYIYTYIYICMYSYASMRLSRLYKTTKRAGMILSMELFKD